LVSVIIPTYNRYQFIGLAIDSVLKQSYTDIEIIIVDDGSSDGTNRLIRHAFGAGVRYIHQSNRGVSAARNTGIAAARGEYIAFLDSDDWWRLDKIAQQLNVLQQSPQYQVCYTNEKWFMNGQPINQHKHHQKFSGWVFEKALPLCLISPSSALMHRSVLERIGGFNEILPVCEDYDLWLRLTALYPVIFLDQPLVYKRGGHADQLSRQLPVMDYYRILALADFIRGPIYPRVYIEAARRTLEQKLKIVIKGAIKHRNEVLLRQLEPLVHEFLSE